MIIGTKNQIKTPFITPEKVKKENIIPYENEDKVTLSGPGNKSENVGLIKKTLEKSGIDIKKDISTAEKKPKENPLWLTNMINIASSQADIFWGFKVAGKLSATNLVGTSMGAVGLAALGYIDLKKGIEHKDKLKMFEGTTGFVAAGSCASDFISSVIEFGGIKNARMHRINRVAEKTAVVLGVTEGAMDFTLGIAQFVKGVKNDSKKEKIDGVIDMTMGVTEAAVSVYVGNPLFAIALISLLGARVAFDYKKQLGEIGQNMKKKFKLEKKTEEKKTEEKK